MLWLEERAIDSLKYASRESEFPGTLSLSLSMMMIPKSLGDTFEETEMLEKEAVLTKTLKSKRPQGLAKLLGGEVAARRRSKSCSEVEAHFGAAVRRAGRDAGRDARAFAQAAVALLEERSADERLAFMLLDEHASPSPRPLSRTTAV